MIPIEVECYSGYKASERPVRFTLGTSTFHVEVIEDQWYSPDAMYFRVLANDGKTYVLKHNEGQDQWTLEVYRASDAL